ncbi:hypothetical protein [Streptomyces spectabilis]|uniref:Uncharacterized protein n=1 Tax=Streptomyces spectabilis TaxID=68270 RepID=A0A516R1P4_STRST|nr:hypothetical protein [Streptomyces spectabilis]QDQ09584.1 hypothetical protein FH965_02600 [Streptomyces spectabilis]
MEAATVGFTSAVSGPRLKVTFGKVAGPPESVQATVTNTGGGTADRLSFAALDTSVRQDPLKVFAVLKQVERLNEERKSSEPDEEYIESLKKQVAAEPLSRDTQTDDPRCVSIIAASQCRLDGLKTGESTQVSFKAQYASRLRWNAVPGEPLLAVKGVYPS